MELENKLKAYYMTAIFSIVFAVVGFSYNAWRLELSEDNNNIRSASFKVLTVLAELEQIIYAAHYDKDVKEGSPRKGWVKVGLIVDLSSLISDSSEERAQKLKAVWQKNWDIMMDDIDATTILVNEIDYMRSEIKLTLKELE